MKKGIVHVFLALVLGWGVHSCASPEPKQPADSILYNGKIITVDADFSYAESLAIAGGKILAVGSNEDIERWAGQNTRKIDLHGKTVMPGMADNHFHSAGGGPGVDLSRVRSMPELLAAIEARVKTSEPGGVILTNSDWHEAQLTEQRLPLRRDLDQVAPEHPVIVVRGGHEYILNSAALKKWNVTKQTRVPEGGRITRYEDGELNGELVDTAKRLVDLQEPPAGDGQNDMIQDLIHQHQQLLAVGLTSIRHPGAPIEQFRALKRIKEEGNLKIRVNFLVRGRFGSAEEVGSAVDSWNVQPDEGDEWLRIGGVKLGVDGGFEGGWMREPYAEPYGENKTFYGLQTVPEKTFKALVREFGNRNWRVATHAVGDAAIDLVLAGYEEFHREHSIKGRRWVIEHGFIPRPDQFPKMKEMELLISAQDHLYVAGPSLEKYWGRERAEWTTPVRTYLDNGIPVSLGTDSPVVPYPPLWVIYHFVTRNTISGGVFGESERISREEALRLITRENAYLTFEEDSKGSLEPGKLADLVVLSEDIMTCPDESIRDMNVLLTMVNGEIVYQDKSFEL